MSFPLKVIPFFILLSVIFFYFLLTLLLVATDKNGHIVGYAYASAFITRSACDWSVETSIYVDKTCCGKHVGAKLYDVLEDILKAQNVVTTCAYICSSYEESMIFFIPYPDLLSKKAD